MKEKINIAEILKDKPQGTKLYSPIFGNLRYEDLVPDLGEFTVVTSDNTLSKHSFRSDSRYNRHGEPLMLLPSKEMQDWSKFSWKRGDVLVTEDGTAHLIFEKFTDDTYTTFIGKYHYANNDYYVSECDSAITDLYILETENSAQTYINTIEKRLGGKLNLETLKIEKAQPEFKDGDIVALVVRKCTHIAIFQSRQEAYIGFHAVLCQNDELLLEEPFREDVGDIELRLATDSEKQQLFDALEKEGKAWDSEKKQIVDLKPKWIPKPFDRVITRIAADDVWTANIFSHMDSHGEYVTIACVGGYTHCLPYNEETAKLIGTTDNWEG